MPSQQEVQWSQLKVGAMVLVALAVLVLLAILFGLAPLRAAMSNASQTSLRSASNATQTSVMMVNGFFMPGFFMRL